MEESLNRIDTMLDVLYSKMEDVKFGSEDFERLFGAIEKLENARAKVIESMTELEVKERQHKFNLCSLGITGVGAIVIPIIAIFVQRKTNIDLLIFERDGIIPHVGYENNPVRLINNFRR